MFRNSAETCELALVRNKTGDLPGVIENIFGPAHVKEYGGTMKCPKKHVKDDFVQREDLKKNMNKK